MSSSSSPVMALTVQPASEQIFSRVFLVDDGQTFFYWHGCLKRNTADQLASPGIVNGSDPLLFAVGEVDYVDLRFILLGESCRAYDQFTILLPGVFYQLLQWLGRYCGRSDLFCCYKSRFYGRECKFYLKRHTPEADREWGGQFR